MKMRKLFTVLMKNDRTRQTEEYDIMARSASEAKEIVSLRLNWDWMPESVTAQF